MPQQKSKKILIYFFLFVIIGTFNNKNFNNLKFPKIDKIKVNGLDRKDTSNLELNLNYLKTDNLFFIDKVRINEIVNSNELVEKFSVFKEYPSSLKIDIIKTEYLAYVKKDDKIFFLGSNGKLIKSDNVNKNLPYIFGKFKNDEFFNLRKDILETKFQFNEIKNLFYFKSGRWDIETYSGLKIKLPKNDIQQSLDQLVEIINKFDSEKINIVDFRQSNQIIIDEQ